MSLSLSQTSFVRNRITHQPRLHITEQTKRAASAARFRLKTQACAADSIDWHGLHGRGLAMSIHTYAERQSFGRSDKFIVTQDDAKVIKEQRRRIYQYATQTETAELTAKSIQELLRRGSEYADTALRPIHTITPLKQLIGLRQLAEKTIALKAMHGYLSGHLNFNAMTDHLNDSESRPKSYIAAFKTLSKDRPWIVTIPSQRRDALTNYINGLKSGVDISAARHSQEPPSSNNIVPFKRPE